MPNQTTKTENVFFPDGCEVAVKAQGDPSFFDVGAINSAVTATLEYEENQVTTANAGDLDKQISNMTMTGGFTLINLDFEGIEKMGGGLFERTTTTDTPVSSNLTDQVVSGTWVNTQVYDLEIINSSTNDNYIASALTLTSVTASIAGVLAANDDYTLHVHKDARSGFGISFNTAGSAGVTATEDITIVFASVTPIVSTVTYMGASTLILETFEMRLRHTDDNGKVRQLDLYAVDSTSGGFQFNFKGANEDGVEEMPVSFVAKLDTSKTSGRQLAAFTVETGAQ
jgi:hypothetical protein